MAIIERMIKATENNLKAIKRIVDSYYDDTITVTIGNDDFDSDNHIYDISVIMGMLSNHIYSALHLDIPNRMEVRK